MFAYPTGASDISYICRKYHEPSIRHHLPALRHGEIGTHADRRVPILLHLHWLRGDAAAEGRRLLRILFVWLGSMPADPGRAFGADRHIAVLRWIAMMAGGTVETSRDWLRSRRTAALVW